MKWIALIGFVLLLSGGTGRGDMQITLNNRIVGEVVAPVSRPDGSGAGTGVTAQLFIVETNGNLVPVAPSTTFRTTSSAASYFLIPLNVTIPGIQPREKVTLRLRAWEGKEFATSPLRGESKDFELINNGVVNNLIGLKEFKLIEQKLEKP